MKRGTIIKLIELLQDKEKPFEFTLDSKVTHKIKPQTYKRQKKFFLLQIFVLLMILLFFYSFYTGISLLIDPPDFPYKIKYFALTEYKYFTLTKSTESIIVKLLGIFGLIVAAAGLVFLSYAYSLKFILNKMIIDDSYFVFWDLRLKKRTILKKDIEKLDIEGDKKDIAFLLTIHLKNGESIKVFINDRFLEELRSLVNEQSSQLKN